MLAGILAANMSSLDALLLQLSALFVRNLYLPLFPDKSEKNYVLVGRIAIILLLVFGIIIAKYIGSVMALIKFGLGTAVTVGAPILLIFLWRRLTEFAVFVEVIVCMLMLFALPLTLPLVKSVNSTPSLLLCTHSRLSETDEYSSTSDSGDQMVMSVSSKPTSVYFDIIEHSDPFAPSSPLVGRGCFRLNLYLLDKLGFDFVNYSPAAILTANYIFSGIFPFLILVGLSFATTPMDGQILDRFYAKMLTPVHPNSEIDTQEIAASVANPHRFDHNKLFPNSQWEFRKWTKSDTIGFVLCWIGVVFILGFLWLILKVGS